ncbi:MAG: fimbria major subunit [Muribaculaceae bacterium]|nr:fimbria major subunit [Muribaculaceae bacterium]
MNILSKLFLGTAVLAMAACSNEEILGDEDVNGNQVEDIIRPEGDVAYLNVSLNAASSSSPNMAPGRSRAGDYVYGNETEGAVQNAYFFFYDRAGNYMLQSNSWLGGSAGSTENIEFKGKNTVVLKGLTGKEYPNWVVTVLNVPDNFVPGATLDEMGRKILNSYKTEGGHFIMTTSSYFGADNAKDQEDGEGHNYFATKLDASYFFQETPDPAEEATNVLQIYVERLAVRVGIDLSLLKGKELADVKYHDEVSGKDYALYEVDVTVAGDPNPDVNPDPDAPAGVAATKVYVALTGWELNATAKTSKLMKDLSGWDANTKFGGTNWAWNNEAYHRSYWGKSTVYGLAGDDLKQALNHGVEGWENLNTPVDASIYCLETTNDPANYSAPNNQVSPSKTPTVLLRAVACDDKGNPLQLVNYRGVEYLKADFIKQALFNIRPVDMMAAYYTRTKIGTDAEGNDIYHYDEISDANVHLVSGGYGLGSVKLAVNTDNTYFKLLEKVTSTDDKGNTVETWKAQEVSAEAVNKFLAGATTGDSNEAIAKTDGAMFYTIPLKHLNTAEAGNAPIEAQHGLVRNHIYNLAISRIKTLGQGVFVPRTTEDGKPEVIDPEDPKDPTYFVESAINILSWRVVSQTEEI